MQEMIRIENVQYAYDHQGHDGSASRVFALCGVSMTVREGEFLAILGHNGSGKSTLAGHFNAIRVPTLGTVYVNGIDTRQSDRIFDIRKNVGMVFQNPDNQLVATVVEEDVAFALENMGVEPSEIRRRVDEALKAVGMYEFKTHAPHLLSGGQKQRIAIAGIIAMMPRCIVLDEPTAMLDPYGRKEVMRVVMDLCKRFGIGVVLITHHMDEAAKADRVIVMNRGTILLEGKAEKIFTEVEVLKAAGLAVPPTVQLLYDLNQQGAALPICALDEETCADILEKYITQA